MNFFAQKSGEWSSSGGGSLAFGYSGGDCGNAPQGVNNPSEQMTPNVGPLPQGLYTIGAPYDHPRLGKYVMPLTPDPSNEMFGRGEFFVHGDLIGAVGQQKASDGCVILPLAIRQQIWNSGDHDLRVVSGIQQPVDIDGEISV